MENLAKDLLGLKMCSFLPKHERNLSNDFRCFVNYPSRLLSSWAARGSGDGRDWRSGETVRSRALHTTCGAGEDSGDATGSGTLLKYSGREKCKASWEKTWKEGSYVMYILMLFCVSFFLVFVSQVYLCDSKINKDLWKIKYSDVLITGKKNAESISKISWIFCRWLPSAGLGVQLRMTYACVKANPFCFFFFFHFYGTITECKPNASKSYSLAPTRVGPVRLTTKTHSGIFTAACRLIEYFQILEKKFKCIKCMSRQFHLHLLGGSRPVILKYTQTSLSISSRFALSNNNKQTRN